MSLIFEKSCSCHVPPLSGHQIILTVSSVIYLFSLFLGRLKLTVLSEDRLQMKWKEADGPVQGYKVRVRSNSGETFSAVHGIRAIKPKLQIKKRLNNLRDKNSLWWFTHVKP